MNKVRYICNDRNIAVEVEDLPGIRRTRVTIFVYKKVAWEFYFRASLDQNIETEAYLERKVVAGCKRLMSLTEKQVEEEVEDANRVMIALYARTHLKELRTKLGTIVWQK